MGKWIELTGINPARPGGKISVRPWTITAIEESGWVGDPLLREPTVAVSFVYTTGGTMLMVRETRAQVLALIEPEIPDVL